MNEPEVIVQFDGRLRTYEPGQLLSGSYRLDAGQQRVRRIEVSVLWRTTGKGDEDFGIHFFDHYSADAGEEVDAQSTARFTTQLPSTPLSYQGAAVNIQWLVRVRAFFENGKEAVGERAFRLGHVPPAREVIRSAPEEPLAEARRVESEHV